MESNKKTRTLFILNQGAWMGLSLSAFFYLRHLLGLMQSSGAELVSWAIYAGFVYFTIKNYRDRFLEGTISYGQGLWAGTRVGLWAGIVLGAYLFTVFKFIDPGYLEEMVVNIQEAYLQSGMSEKLVEDMDEIMRTSMTPGMMIFSGILTVGFGSFFFALILSAFLKKEGDPFQQVMKNID